TVNGTGLVTGVAPGKVKITATDQETQLSASVEVTVNPVAVKSENASSVIFIFCSGISCSYKKGGRIAHP
ncbi:Ig-like domain-containing protein, partial [Escherichia coli]|uniref:Ig-like domain-containing protein n=1 Tax=Escherichia coli TaxID=562 RepID=UPI003EDFC809